MRGSVFVAAAAVLLLAAAASGQEILLDQMVEAEGLKCFPIQGDAATWYYLPDKPHLATDADGNPEFSFLMYVTPSKQTEGGINTAPGGGIVHFLVAYDVPQDQVRRAQNALARLKPGAKLVGPVNYVDGAFVLVTAVTDPQAGLSRRVVGVGNAPLMAGHKAAVSMHLTPEGATLLWESFKQRTPDISVNFEMTVSGYRNPVEATMAIDWAKVNQTMQIQAAARYSFAAAEVDVLLQNMRNNGAIKVELKGAPPAQWTAIQDLGLDLAKQYIFESEGAGGLSGLGGLGPQESPLDRLWKTYGDEWKQQQRTSRLDLVPRTQPWLTAEVGPAWWDFTRRVAWRSHPLFAGSLSAAAQNETASAPASCSYGVHLLGQPTKVSCWATSAAMIAGWRDQMTIDPTSVPTDVAWLQSVNWMKAFYDEMQKGLKITNIPDLAYAYDLAEEPQATYTAWGLGDLLCRHGPLWLAGLEDVATPEGKKVGGHAVVVSGIRGDGTAAGSEVEIYNPWPVGQGRHYWQDYASFLRWLEPDSETALEALGFSSQILHAMGGGPAAQMENCCRFTERLSGARAPDTAAAAKSVTQTVGRTSDTRADTNEPPASDGQSMPRRGEPLTPAQQEAKNLFERGQTAYGKQQYAMALELFEAANARLPLPEFDWNIGLTHVRLGHRDGAVGALGRYIEGKGGAGQHPRLRAAVDELTGEQASIPSERRSGWVEKLKEADQGDISGEAAAPAAEAGTVAPEAVTKQASGAGTPCQEADTLFHKAVEAWDTGRIEDCIRYHEQANALCSQADYVWNLFTLNIAVGRRDLAVAYLDRYLEQDAQCRKKPRVAAARDLIAAAPAVIPEEMRAPLWMPLEQDCGSARTKGIKLAAAAAPIEQAQAGQQATTTAVPGKTATPIPAKTPTTAAGTPTRTATPSVTPTPTPKPEKPTNWGVIASFKLRRIKSTGGFNLNLKQWLRTEQAVRFAANVGNLSGRMDDPRYFRRVNLDDPMFRERVIPVTVDVAGEEAFAAMLNAVTVTVRKRHESGRETLAETTISRAEFAKPSPPTLIYGWDQDNNRTRWLEYETRLRWNYVGGPVIETPWQKTSAGALVLAPPLRPRTLILESDPAFLQAEGVRDVVLEVRYQAGGSERLATATVRASAPSGETKVLLYQDPQQPAYTYSYTWRLRGGQRLTGGPFTDSADIIYLDEIPSGS